MDPDPTPLANAVDRLRQGLARHTLSPAGARTHVFGSRATGRARRYSDLDLAIDAGRRLTEHERAALAEAFEDSDLPWKVDLVDTQAATPAFRRAIEPQWIELA